MEARCIKTIKVEKWFCAETNSNVTHNFTMKRGEYILIDSPSGIKAIIACPQCGSKNPIVTHDLIFHREKQPIVLSIKPSIDNKQCCGYHGYLTNNRFTNVK